MRAQALAQNIAIDRVDLETLDRFLSSQRSSPNSMMLSGLDGFLTGIAIGPEPIPPIEWLPPIWGGDVPELADAGEADKILGAIMARYDEILRDIADDALAPIFWEDRNGTLSAADWAEGFFEAIKLRPDAWEPLFASKRYGRLLFPIVLSLCGDDHGASLLGAPPEVEERMVEGVPKLIPGCIIGIGAFWRCQGPRSIAATAKVGRNEACPCGSGRKFKKCCGQVV